MDGMERAKGRSQAEDSVLYDPSLAYSVARALANAETAQHYADAAQSQRARDTYLASVAYWRRMAGQ